MRAGLTVMIRKILSEITSTMIRCPYNRTMSHCVLLREDEITREQFPRSILVTSSRGCRRLRHEEIGRVGRDATRMLATCPPQVVRVVLVDLFIYLSINDKGHKQPLTCR